MRKILIIITGLFLIQNLYCQTYYPFPTDTAQWNSLTWAQWSPINISLINSQYIIQGDTNIDGQEYNKIYYFHTDNTTPYIEYIGGMREDSLKNIYFFPSSLYIPNYAGTKFPNDTSESLLYTFNNLEIGMILPINPDFTVIEVVDIDSVLLGNNYRKRYKIQQEGMGGNQYWIEGIGSDKDLFATYSYEFEWELYTLCFSDTVTYYLNSPNGEDSCHYWIPIGLNEISAEKFYIYPNPATQTIKIETEFSIEEGVINIYNIYGQNIIKSVLTKSNVVIDISHLESGIYIIEIIKKNRKLLSKFVKK